MDLTHQTHLHMQIVLHSILWHAQTVRAYDCTAHLLGPSDYLLSPLDYLLSLSDYLLSLSDYKCRDLSCAAGLSALLLCLCQ